MKKAVMYGAGNIGRGFIGKVLSESGYEVCFLDIAQDIIAAFNKDRQYTVKVVSNEEQRNDIVKNVRAVDANTPQAIKEIADCDLMATSVGVNVMPYIVGNIAEGIKMRMKQGNRPLDIILAENQLDADKIMRNFIYEKLNDEQKAWADKNLGLVEASIGRMVPPLTADERTQNPLLIAVEEYALLPVDSAAFKGEIPQLVGI
ncbi:MAG: mannitol dehydrogenase, partial [Christensenellaceae bacterium]